MLHTSLKSLIEAVEKSERRSDSFRMNVLKTVMDVRIFGIHHILTKGFYEAITDRGLSPLKIRHKHEFVPSQYVFAHYCDYNGAFEFNNLWWTPRGIWDIHASVCERKTVSFTTDQLIRALIAWNDNSHSFGLCVKQSKRGYTLNLFDYDVNKRGFCLTKRY